MGDLLKVMIQPLRGPRQSGGSYRSPGRIGGGYGGVGDFIYALKPSLGVTFTPSKGGGPMNGEGER